MAIPDDAIISIRVLWNDWPENIIVSAYGLAQLIH